MPSPRLLPSHHLPKPRQQSLRFHICARVHAASLSTAGSIAVIGIPDTTASVSAQNAVEAARSPFASTRLEVALLLRPLSASTRATRPVLPSVELLELREASAQSAMSFTALAAGDGRQSSVQARGPSSPLPALAVCSSNGPTWVAALTSRALTWGAVPLASHLESRCCRLENCGGQWETSTQGREGRSSCQKPCPLHSALHGVCAVLSRLPRATAQRQKTL